MRFATAMDTVKTPTLPANIVMIIKIWLTGESACVIPVESPTVAKAETVSNSRSEA